MSLKRKSASSSSDADAADGNEGKATSVAFDQLFGAGVEQSFASKRAWKNNSNVAIVQIHFVGTVLILGRGDNRVVQDILMKMVKSEKDPEVLISRFSRAPVKEPICKDLGENITMFWKYNGRGSVAELTDLCKKAPCFEGWKFVEYPDWMPLQMIASSLKLLEFLQKWRGTPPPDDKIFIAGNGMTGKKLLDRGKKLKLEVFDNIDV